MDLATKKWLVTWRLQDRPELVSWNDFVAITEGVLTYGLCYHYQRENGRRFFSVWADTLPRFSLAIVEEGDCRITYRADRWPFQAYPDKYWRTPNFDKAQEHLLSWVRELESST